MISNINLKFLQIPLILISTTLIVCGIRWLSHDQPWILDQIANEERLNMSFDELFLINGNQTLNAYLTQIYRFLGLYVLGIGVLLISFSSKKILKINIVRKRVLTVLGFLLFSNLILAYIWIPSSHFIYVIWSTIVLYVISLYVNKKY
ncbi:MAG: hypothetical protein O3C01_06285 [Bacteroidetes bacterium]|jgi:hypothetical protein|nr:hypothetical protein [Bacteroidota bacterium]MDA1019494.1 hypothetical protein [Bacteroidota bacterium]|tara:strand:- start:44206 stop:44649 length:444 start_codon:yes stop_codon:yes gene_type:complete